LDGTTLRVAQANQRDLKLVATAQIDLPPEADRTDASAVGASVKRALAGLDLKPASVVMGVGRPRVVLRTVRLPVVENVAELASLVHFQVAKDLPFPPEEAVIDFVAVRQIQVSGERVDAPAKPEAGAESGPPSPRLEVLVAAVKRETVEFHQQLAAAAGFKLVALSLLPYGNSRGIAACEVTGEPEVAALVSIRPDEVSVEVMDRGSLVFSRGTIMRAIGETPHIEGSIPISEEAFIQAAAIEVVRSLHSYGGTEPGRPVGKVLVAGATNYETALLETLRGRVSVPCVRLDPAEALRLPAQFREAAAGSIGTIGLALGAGDEHGLPFDFLNPKRPAPPRNLRRVRILTGATVVTVLLVLLLGVRKLLIDRRTNLLKATAGELADAEKQRPIYRGLIGRAAVVEDWVKGGRDWLQHYAYLSSVLPPCDEVYLGSLVVDRQGVIRLAVQSRSGETLSRLSQKLREAGYDVKPFAINPGANRFEYVFRSNIELVASPKLKIDLSKLKTASRPADDASLDPKAWRRGGG